MCECLCVCVCVCVRVCVSVCACVLVRVGGGGGNGLMFLLSCRGTCLYLGILLCSVLIDGCLLLNAVYSAI